MRKNSTVAKLMLLLGALVLLNPAVAAVTSPRALFTTNLGDITVELYPQQAPKSVANFIHYVDSGFYNGVIFHRVIPNFMVQAGGFNSALEHQTTAAPIVNEASNGLSNDRGTLALARTSNPDSATSQFFINLKDNEFLNRSGDHPQQAGYAVFGKVISGMDVVDKMAQQPTGNNQGHSDVPLTPIVINSAVMLK